MALVFGSLGNGLSVWRKGSNNIIAHINCAGYIDFKDTVTKEESWQIQVASNRERVKGIFLQQYPQFANTNDYWIHVYMADEKPAEDEGNRVWFFYQDFLVSIKSHCSTLTHYTMFTVTPVEAGKEAFNVYAEAGVSIIRGTHRPQDLIPAWMNVIRDSHYFGGLLDSVPHGAIRYTNGEWHIEENHPWFDSEDCNQWFVNDDLWGAMELSAPTGHYFGTLEGDGSDFGFWPYREQE